jgi:hypothetical protein
MICHGRRPWIETKMNTVGAKPNVGDTLSAGYPVWLTSRPSGFNGAKWQANELG